MHRKFSITPFTPKSIKMGFIILVLFLGFYFWDFNLPAIEVQNFSITPIINILIKTVLITVVYVYLVLKLKVSNEFDALLQKFYKFYK